MSSSMPPPLKRKRPDRPSGDVPSPRPSPHRPADTPLAQHDRDDSAGRGGRGRGHHRGGFQRRDSNPAYGRGGSNHHFNQQQHAQSHQQQNARRQSNPSTAQNTGFATPAQPAPAQQATRPLNPPASPASRKPSASTAMSANATATKTLPSPAPANQPPGPMQAEVISQRPPYCYEILTDDRVAVWAERGRKDIIQHGVQSREDVDMTELSSLFQEFIHAVVDARLDSADAGACVKEILGPETDDVLKDAYSFAPHALFLDTLALVSDMYPDFYRPSVRHFLVATEVSPALMRQVLDAPLLQQLGLIRDTFARLGVRQATNLLYRQANYNLLREESEGYSKLITEIFSTNTVPPPPPSNTFERVKALIGTFDLDVGRVLDVTLDVAAAVLIKQVKFFIKFLRTSSWWPSLHHDDGSPFVGGLPVWANPNYPHWNTTEEDRHDIARRKQLRDVAFWDRARQVHLAAFFELGGRRVSDAQLEQLQTANGHDSDDAADNIEMQWARETKTLPPAGNRVAAQLLGFKLRFYNSETRDKTDVLPANLLYLASLLIKIGFISMTDLYSHLFPEDSGMERVRQQEADKLAKQEREARGGQMNALLMAGVLPQGDDDNPMASSSGRKELPSRAELEQKKAAAVEEAAKKDKLPEPMEQKVALLIQLLTIGAIPESLFLLGRFPWIPEVFPEVLQRLHRILHVCLEKVYRDSRPCAATEVEIPTKQLPDVDQTGVAKGNVRTSRLPTKRIWRWPFPDACDTNETSNYRFYLDEWDDNVPICQTVDDVFTLCSSLLNVSGVNIGKDEALLNKLASIGSQSLAVDSSHANRARWEQLLRRLLLPALSHTKANPPVVNAIWELAQQYPLTTRYAMYAEWFEGQVSRLPAMQSAFARATSETRATMKRVSLTNLSEMAKRLAKTSYSSPGIVFKVAFEQLEVYPNLIDAFVECAKYFTDLCYDVAVWSLLSSLGKARSRTQENHALTTSKWLQALSRFSGRVFRRYPVLDPVPVLEYVDEQLLQGNATDLIILKEFISSMGGIVDAADFTEYQVLCMAGGAWLRRHTLIRAQDKRFESSKSSSRLIHALSGSQLASRLLLSLAQYRQMASYQVSEDMAHIKFLSSTADDSHQIIIQFLDFLWSNLEPAVFDKIVPPIPVLLDSYGLQAELAFLIGRGSLGHRMFPWKEAKAKKDAAAARRPGVDREGDVKMSDAKPLDAESTDATSSGATDVEMQQKPDDASLTRTALTALQPVIESVKAAMPPAIWRKMTPELYTTFWALQLGDICFPEEAYTKERQKVMGEWQALANDRSDMSRRAVDRKMEKRKELMDLQGYLLDELSEHGLRKAKWKFYLTKMFQASFPDTAAGADSISDLLLEHCFQPRLLISPADAEYTFRFIKTLHDSNAPVFKLMSLYDRLFNANRLRAIIFNCTVRETEYLGRFLSLILEELARWHKNEPTTTEKDGRTTKDSSRLGPYDKEAKGAGDQVRLGFALTVDAQGKPETFVEHAQFRDMLFRWHKNLNTALKACLSGSEWMHIRNAITVLKAVLDYFPAVDFMAAQFIAQLQKITKREAAGGTGADGEEGGRVDLSVASQGAMSELQKRKPRWVMVQAFRSNAAGDKPSSSSLRPTAADFKPSRPANSKASSAEKEDGEVQDATDAQRQAKTQTPRESVQSKQPSAVRDASARQDVNSQPSTPKAGPTQTNTEIASSSHKLPDRPERPSAHTLPNRPDVLAPGHGLPERYAQGRGGDRREGREARATRDVRGETREARDIKDPRDILEAKPHEADRNGPRPHAMADRRPAPDANGETSRGDVPSRLGQHDREAAPVAERTANFASDGPDRPMRGAGSDRQPRAQWSTGNDASSGGNMERNTAPEDRNDGTIPFSQSRSRRDDSHERAPRTPSPRRSIRHPQEMGGSGSFDDRSHSRAFSQDQRPPVRAPRDRSPPPAQAYRGERAADRDVDRGGETMRDPSGGFHRAAPRGPEAENRMMPHQDQNYGRLNSTGPGQEAPSGPRGRGRGGSRGGNYGAYPTTSSRFVPPDAQQVPSPDRSAPSIGPGVGRGRNLGQESTSGPGTPMGAHGGPPPEMGRNFTGGARHDTRYDARHDAQMTSSSPSAAAAAGPPPAVVHPDRLARMDSGLPPPMSTHPPQGHDWQAVGSGGGGGGGGSGDRHGSRTRQPFPPSMGPPPPTDAGVPTGPAANERGRGGGGRRQIGGINNMLQQSQATPDLTRGNVPNRGPSRQLLGNSDAQVLVGGSPASTPVQERHEATWPQVGDGNGGGGAWGPATNGRERDSRNDRLGRSFRRSSRERGRSPRGGREGEAKDQGEYRERRSTSTAELMASDRRAGWDGAPGGRNTPGMGPGGGRDPSGSRDIRQRTDGGPGGPGAGGASMGGYGGGGHGHGGHGGPGGHAGPGPHAGPGGYRSSAGDDWAGPRGGGGYRSGHGGAGHGGHGGHVGGGHGGGGHGGGGPREGGMWSGEDRRDHRGDDRGRKRRSEDGVGLLASERDKRPRRG